MLLMSWNKIVTCFAVMCTMIILCSCSSQASLQYIDTKSDFLMVKNIEQQYQQWRGTPYRYGGYSVKGIDCSAFVNNFYDQKINMPIPRATVEQVKIGKKVSKLQAGDLIFFKTGQGENGLHVGIYYKNGQFLHVSTSRGVEFASLQDSYWKAHYWQAKRVVS